MSFKRQIGSGVEAESAPMEAVPVSKENAGREFFREFVNYFAQSLPVEEMERRLVGALAQRINAAPLSADGSDVSQSREAGTHDRNGIALAPSVTEAPESHSFLVGMAKGLSAMIRQGTTKILHDVTKDKEKGDEVVTWEQEVLEVTTKEKPGDWLKKIVAIMAKTFTDEAYEFGPQLPNPWDKGALGIAVRSSPSYFLRYFEKFMGSPHFELLLEEATQKAPNVARALKPTIAQKGGEKKGARYKAIIEKAIEALPKNDPNLASGRPEDVERYTAFQMEQARKARELKRAALKEATGKEGPLEADGKGVGGNTTQLFGVEGGTGLEQKGPKEANPTQIFGQDPAKPAKPLEGETLGQFLEPPAHGGPGPALPPEGKTMVMWERRPEAKTTAPATREADGREAAAQGAPQLPPKPPTEAQTLVMGAVTSSGLAQAGTPLYYPPKLDLIQAPASASAKLEAEGKVSPEDATDQGAPSLEPEPPTEMAAKPTSPETGVAEAQAPELEEEEERTKLDGRAHNGLLPLAVAISGFQQKEQPPKGPPVLRETPPGENPSPNQVRRATPAIRVLPVLRPVDPKGGQGAVNEPKTQAKGVPEAKPEAPKPEGWMGKLRKLIGR